VRVFEIKQIVRNMWNSTYCVTLSFMLISADLFLLICELLVLICCTSLVAVVSRVMLVQLLTWQFIWNGSHTYPQTVTWAQNSLTLPLLLYITCADSAIITCPCLFSSTLYTDLVTPCVTI
jgi:hypothetical protein